MLAALLLLLAAPPPDSAAIYRGAAGELRVAIPRHEQVEIDLDGRLDEPIWAQAAMLTDFTMYEPVEGEAARERTEVHVFYGHDAIYFGIRAYDSEPDRIRATLGERDRVVFNDDWVRIMLDTFNDQRSAYCFYVNPFGLQTDGLWVEGKQSESPVPIDFNQDYIWDSNGRLDEAGWTVEIRIPYVSLRFREVPEQDWGLNVARETRRNGYKVSWAPITANRTSTLGQSGMLTGLRDLQPQRLVEVNPVLTGRRTGQIVDSNFEMDSFEPDFGFNTRVGITQNLVADATINPDFSQIEADADQITVNERFALFVTEKRPFFLEGTDIFATPEQLVYTRRIVDPVGGAKITGKVGAFNVGYMGALDDAPRLDPQLGERALFNVMRVRRDIGTGSTVGALYTDRTMTGDQGYNRVASADARIVFAQQYAFTTQLAHAWTRAAGAEDVATAPLFYGSLARNGRTFAFTLTAEDVPPEFRAETGFLRRIGDAHGLASATLNHHRPAGSFLEQIGVTTKYEAFQDHDELFDTAPFESEIQIEPSFQFRGANSVRVILRRGYFRFSPEDFDNYGVLTDDGVVPIPTPAAVDNMQALALIPRLRPLDWLGLEGRLYLREIPIYQEGQRGLEVQVAPTLKLWPTEGLSLEAAFTHSQIDRSSDDTRFSTQNLMRVKAQYQFSRSLFARVIGQYNLRSRDALKDPITGLPLVSLSGGSTGAVSGGDFGANILLSYEPSPGTLMYIGWTRQMIGPDSWDLASYDRAAEGLFVKISYLYRL